MKLTGKIAVVTGASRGIGKAIVTRLASEGAIVAINFTSILEYLKYRAVKGTVSDFRSGAMVEWQKSY
jgi:NAD(P)-dependent dehydrogenase (short-subunit alcohol dehydrogenase family)